jgi:hypothetical protein
VVLFISVLDRKTIGKFALASLAFFGLVLWVSEYVEEPPLALEFNDGYFKGIRPTAFAAGLFLEVGLLGTVAFCFSIFRHLWKLPYLIDPFWRAVFNLFLFSFLLVGTIGDPLPYIGLSMAYLATTKFKRSEFELN